MKYKQGRMSVLEGLEVLNSSNLEWYIAEEMPTIETAKRKPTLDYIFEAKDGDGFSRVGLIRETITIYHYNDNDNTRGHFSPNVKEYEEALALYKAIRNKLLPIHNAA